MDLPEFFAVHAVRGRETQAKSRRLDAAPPRAKTASQAQIFSETCDSGRLCPPSRKAARTGAGCHWRRIHSSRLKFQERVRRPDLSDPLHNSSNVMPIRFQYSASARDCSSPSGDNRSGFESNGRACPWRTTVSVLISRVRAWRWTRCAPHPDHRPAAACANSPTSPRAQNPGKRRPRRAPEWRGRSRAAQRWARLL
jgi:hypothetical protein